MAGLTHLNMVGLTHPNIVGLTHLVVRFDPPVSILFSVLFSCLVSILIINKGMPVRNA
jgi:hypothetical protein